MTISGKFIAAMTTRPAFLDKSKKLQAEFDSLPEFLRNALKGQTEPPPDVAQSLIDREKHLTNIPGESLHKQSEQKSG